MAREIIVQKYFRPSLGKIVNKEGYTRKVGDLAESKPKYAKPEYSPNQAKKIKSMEKESDFNKDDVRELLLFIDNDYDTYKTLTSPTERNLAMRKRKDEFNPKLALISFRKIVDFGVTRYNKEVSKKNFSTATKNEVAKELLRYFEGEYALGNYDEREKQFKSVTIIGRRWRDKINGNTYHTSEVFIDGTRLGKSKMSYGYDDMYKTTGFEILVQNEIFKDVEEARLYFRENHNKIVYSVSDVARQKDM